MDKYNDLELAVLSCLLQKPNFMENNKLDDKYFIKHKWIWIFMKAFYKKFKTFDLNLMYSVAKNKYKICEYIIWILEKEPAPSLFEYYEQQLIDLYFETKKEKMIIEKIYELANELYVRNITLKEFQEKEKNIYEAFKK